MSGLSWSRRGRGRRRERKKVGGICLQKMAELGDELAPQGDHARASRALASHNVTTIFVCNHSQKSPSHYFVHSYRGSKPCCRSNRAISEILPLSNQPKSSHLPAELHIIFASPPPCRDPDAQQARRSRIAAYAPSARHRVTLTRTCNSKSTLRAIIPCAIPVSNVCLEVTKETIYVLWRDVQRRWHTGTFEGRPLKT